MDNETKELVDEGMTQMNATFEALLNHQTLLSNAAKVTKKLLDCLVAEGFTRSEAIFVMAAKPIGGK